MTSPQCRFLLCLKQQVSCHDTCRWCKNDNCVLYLGSDHYLTSARIAVSPECFVWCILKQLDFLPARECLLCRQRPLWTQWELKRRVVVWLIACIQWIFLRSQGEATKEGGGVGAVIGSDFVRVCPSLVIILQLWSTHQPLGACCSLQSWHNVNAYKQVILYYSMMFNKYSL